MDLKFNQLLNKSLDKNQCIYLFKIIEKKMSNDEKNKLIDDLIILTKNINEKINYYNIIKSYASAKQNEKENTNIIFQDFLNILEKNQIVCFLLLIKKNKYNLLLYTKFHILLAKKIITNVDIIELFKNFDDFNDDDIYYIEKKIYEVYEICDANSSKFNVIDILEYYNKNKKQNIDIEINTTCNLLYTFDKINFHDAFCDITQKYDQKVFQDFFSIIEKCIIDNYDSEYIISIMQKIQNVIYHEQRDIFILLSSIKSKINIKFSELLNIFNEIQNMLFENTDNINKCVIKNFIILSLKYPEWDKSDILFVCNSKRTNAKNYLEATEFISKNNNTKSTHIEIYNELKYISVYNLKYFCEYINKFLLIFNKKSTKQIEILYIIENINKFMKMYNGKNIIQKIYEFYDTHNTHNFYDFAINLFTIILKYSIQNEKKTYYIINKLEKIVNNEHGQICNMLHLLWKYDEKKANFIIDECYRNLKLGINKSIEEFIITKNYENSADIHQFSNINFKNNLKKIQFELEINSIELFDFEICLNITKNKINEIGFDDIEYFENEKSKNNNLSSIKNELINFLQSEKFIDVLSLGKPEGKEIFRLTITYLYFHQDLWMAFITQSLWSSIIEQSCCMGIYERLIMWINYKDEEAEFIETIKKDIYYNPKYEMLYYFDDDEYFDYYSSKLRNIKSVVFLKIEFENMMFSLYKELNAELEKKYKKNLNKIFIKNEIKEMFFVFENEISRFKDFYNKIFTQ